MGVDKTSSHFFCVIFSRCQKYLNAREPNEAAEKVNETSIVL